MTLSVESADGSVRERFLTVSLVSSGKKVVFGCIRGCLRGSCGGRTPARKTKQVKVLVLCAFFFVLCALNQTERLSIVVDRRYRRQLAEPLSRGCAFGRA